MSTNRDESLAWDRVGRFLQQSGTTASDIAQRNVRLWSSVSQHLKQDKYTADDLADDLAHSASTAMSNMADVWSIFTRDPSQNTLAQPVPTAFLLFDRAGESRHRLLDPVRIEVGPLQGRGRPLDKTARVELTSIGPWSGPTADVGDDDLGPAPDVSSEEAIMRLRERLVAYLTPDSGAYILANYNRTIELSTEEQAVEQGLAPGVYDGIVYLTDPAALLACIRVVVEGGPPADRPVASEEDSASFEQKATA